MSQSLSPQYYETLEFFKNKFYGTNKTIEDAKHQMDDMAVPIPDNLIVNEVKLDDRYRIKSKEYLEDGLKKYKDVVDEKWKDLNEVKDEGDGDGRNLIKIKLALINMKISFRLNNS
ncbi:15703_t:CDS:2 [Funneliformis geosporum]|nr:15703_t:CDS:2 [Funneliformis geosporum]